MSGFEPSSGHDREADRLEALFPDDFSPEEMAFARELRGLFPIEREVLPPLYVQTLMEDEWRAPTAPSYEQLLARRVFRRLRRTGEVLLAKRAMLPKPSLFVESLTQVSTLSRSVVGSFGMVVLAMFVSVLLTSPAFAQGLQLLLGHTGVQQVGVYPSHVRAPGPVPAASGAAETPKLYWLGPQFAGYGYSGLRQEYHDWAKGPVVHVQYRLPAPNRGSGLLDVRMFQVADKYSAVLQVVRSGSAHEVALGNAHAIYVDGRWETQGDFQAWRAGERSELIFERDGVVFWVMGDQRDGLGQDEMTAAAAKLQPATMRQLMPRLLKQGELAGDLKTLLEDPVGDEVYALVPRDASNGRDANALVQFESRGHHLMP